MRSSIPHLVLTLAIASALQCAHAQNKDAQSPYWQGGTDGWHFYERKPEKPKQPKPETLPPTPPVVMQPPAPQGPAPLSSTWIKENFERIQAQAIDNPTKENVELVAYLQRLSVDKAERYSQAMMQVTIDNPALDEYARSPITTAQRLAAEKQISVAKKQTLEYLSQRLGLWYFYSSTCPYCAKQEPILDRFQARVNFQILPISLDGGPLASGSPKPYVVNAGHAERLGVMMTPTMVVADTATGQVYNLAAGLRTTDEIEDRLLDLARDQQWISSAQYDEAVRGEPRMYLTDGLKNLDELKDDPAALLEALKRASYNGGSTPWRVNPQSQ